MNAGVIILVVIGFVGFFALACWLGAQRRKELQAWASGRGWRFSPAKDHAIETRYGFDCLTRGHSRYARNVSRGEHDQCEAVAFDYHYARGHGKNRRSYSFSAIVIHSPVPLRPLMIRPEGFFDKIVQAVGFDDIDFESAEFSRKFCVKADDRRWAYDVIHQRTMDFLLSSPAFHIELGRRHVIVWRESRLRSAEFDAALGVAGGLLSRLPDYLVQQQTQGVT